MPTICPFYTLGHIVVRKTDKIPALMELTLWESLTLNKYTLVIKCHKKVKQGMIIKSN